MTENFFLLDVVISSGKAVGEILITKRSRTLIPKAVPKWIRMMLQGG
jgi:hypothetical protein